MDEFDGKIYDAIQKYGECKDCRVFYRMEEDLEDILAIGKVQIIFDSIKNVNYKSHVLENPTYLDLAVIANDVINICNFKDHRYLENVYLERENNDIKIYSIWFGS